MAGPYGPASMMLRTGSNGPRRSEWTNLCGGDDHPTLFGPVLRLDEDSVAGGQLEARRIEVLDVHGSSESDTDDLWHHYTSSLGLGSASIRSSSASRGLTFRSRLSMASCTATAA